MVGFVQSGKSTMKEHKVQCYYGMMVKPKHEVMLTDDGKKTLVKEAQQLASDAKDNKASNTAQILSQIAETPDDNTNVALLQKFLLPTKSGRVKHDWIPNEQSDMLIEAVNELELGWTADTCKLQHGNSKRPVQCDEVKDVSLAHKGKKFGEGKDFDGALKEA
jgi:hypothetical protein